MLPKSIGEVGCCQPASSWQDRSTRTRFCTPERTACTAVTKIIVLHGLGQLVLLAPSSPLLGGAGSTDCLSLLLPKHSVETLSTYCSIDFRMI